MRMRNAVAVVILAILFSGLVLHSNIDGSVGFFRGGVIPFHIGNANDEGLDDGEVTTRKIADSAVTGEKIANDVLEIVEQGRIAYETIGGGLGPDNVTFAPGSSTCVVAGSFEEGDFTDVQSAVDSLSDGGVVHVKEGIYELSEGIEIRSSGISLVGSGAGTVLVQKSEDPTIHIGWGAENVTVSNLKIVGNRTKPGIYLTGVKGSKIGYLWVENAKLGIYLKDSALNVVDRNVITGNGDGIKLHASNSNLVLGNLLSGNLGHGIYVLSSNVNVISSNVVRANGLDGVRVRSGANNLIAVNSCSANAGAGVYLGYSGTVNNLVTTNSCIGNKVGVRLTGSVENTRLLANYFSNNLEGEIRNDSNTTRYIRTEDIEDGAITAAKIGPDAIGSDQIMPGAVTTFEIEDRTIGSIDLGDKIVAERNIVDGAVSARKIRDDAIGSGHISRGAVGTGELADDAVTPDKTSLGVLQTGVERDVVDLKMIVGGFRVSFPYEFSEGPNVVVSFANVDDRTALPGSLYVENVTTGGFDVGWVLSGQGVGSADVVWYASVEPEEGPSGVQVLVNPSFEAPGIEGEAPDNWSFPEPYVEEENLTVEENEFVQYGDYYGVAPKDGDYMGRLRLASTAENDWVGLGTEQVVENVGGTADRYLVYDVAFLNWSGSDHADFAGPVVEVDVTSGGENYLLRYIQGYERKVWPEESAGVGYVDVLEGEEMPWRNWISVERDVAQDLVDEFPEIDTGDEFTIKSIGLFSLIHKLDGAKTDIYIGWDGVGLIAAS